MGEKLKGPGGKMQKRGRETGRGVWRERAAGTERIETGGGKEI